MQALHELGRAVALRQRRRAERAAQRQERRARGGRRQRVGALLRLADGRHRRRARAVAGAAHLQDIHICDIFLFL